jgi:hypothetical protein
MKGLWLALLTCLPLAAPAAGNDISKVNGSVRVSAGETAGDVETVNGSVTIEDGVTAENIETVNGSINIGRNSVVRAIETVNGGVSLADGARASRVETVNGTLRLAESAQVSGDVTAVNGAASLDKGADIAGKLSNVNGKMTLSGGHVGRGLHTVNGDITLGPGSRVEGGILVEKPSFNLFRSSRRKPRIIIGPDAVVEGTLKFEHEVDLFVSDRAKIGEVQGARAIAFTGSEPDRKQLEVEKD